MVQPVLKRVAAHIPQDPVEFWLSRLDTDTRAANLSHLNRWMNWLHKQPNWETVTPRELLISHLEAEDSYIVLELVQRYINKLVLRKSSKRKAYSVIRSYFAHNHCPLPQDPSFKIRGDRPPVQSKLTVQDVIEPCHAANLRYRSMYITKWQSMMDNERLIYANLHCSDEIVKQVQMGVTPVKIDLPGRKANENDLEGKYYTYIGNDAIDALTKYFEDERGWPKKGEPIWTYSTGEPVEKAGFEASWLRLFRRMGKVNKDKGPLGSRYGFNLHELRDAATTWLHISAKAAGLDMDCVKFWCGQVGEIDRLKYDKFYQDQNYIRKQYQIAEPYLNILSNPTSITDPQQEEKVQTLEAEVDALKAAFSVMQQQFQADMNSVHANKKLGSVKSPFG